jgi:pimeloyl-ACP methyl ester carboxylesterase
MKSFFGSFFALTLVLSLFLSLNFVSLAANGDASNYTYPYKDPYVASATAVILRPSGAPPSYMNLAALPGRQSVPLLEGRGDLEIGVYAKRGPAPLVFLIPGLGASAQEGLAQHLASKMSEQGFNVLILASPMSWQFTLSQSMSAVPGDTQNDVQDLYRVMSLALAQAKQTYGMRPTSYSVVGYSQGALEAAYVAQLDNAQKRFGFKRVVMINPPLNLQYGIQTVDALGRIGKKMSRDEQDFIWGQAIAAMRAKMDPNATPAQKRISIPSGEKMKFLIGSAFRDTLGEMIFVSQQIRDLGLLPDRATESERTVREEEAKDLGFEGYSKRAVYPHFSRKAGSSLSYSAYVLQGSLEAMQSEIAGDSRYYLMDNMDDFLVQPEVVQEWAAKMRGRAFVYPYGGHMGNVAHPVNQADLKAILAGGK